jgi:serine/threonine protein kinase
MSKVLSLFGNWHPFSPKVPADDIKHDRMVLERMHMCFGPFPVTYKTLADTKTILYLVDIMNSMGQRKPFHMWKDPELEPEDKEFLGKVMKLDPRDRPTAKDLLNDKWLSEE